MKITEVKIPVKDLVKNYEDDRDSGVFGYNHKLTIRPAYQREFIYNDKQRNAVIETIRKGFPLNIMYWSKVDDNKFEVLDGQQRTISIGQFINGDFSIQNENGNDQFFHNIQKITPEKAEQILNYELTIYICEGTEAEKLEWFKVINIAGEVLTNQELLNATYTGPWLADAKKYFSKRGCQAGNMADGYIKGNSIRQEYLEKALKWISDRDNLDNISKYMAIHQHDKDANDLWQYFDEVISWAKRLFPKSQKGITDVQEWGLLYNKYHNNSYNSNKLKEEMDKLMMDDDVTKKAGIIPYLLSERSRHDEKHLSIRTFTEAQKRKAYTAQGGKCAICGKPFAYEEMAGDHKVPWSKGGKTIDSNLQMLCITCNSDKSNK